MDALTMFMNYAELMQKELGMNVCFQKRERLMISHFILTKSYTILI